MQHKKKTLQNGLQIIMVPMSQSLTTTVLVLTETGSKYETKRINGISHFLEHLCFKGTRKRGSAKIISEELDGLGASYNAFTGHEYTGYYAKTEAKYFKKALDIVSDIYMNSTFPKAEIEKERGVIIGEIEMYEDNPQREIWDLLTRLLYGNQPAGWNIAGTRKSVRHVRREDIAAYHSLHYVSRATIVVVAGRFDERTATRDIKTAFGGISRGRKGGKPKIHEIQRKPQFSAKHKKTSQTHIVLGFRSHGVHHKMNGAFSVLANVLGGSMSSRLFQKIRDEMGAGYYVGASNEVLTDHGYFSIFAGINNSRVVEATRAILAEVRRVRDEDISAEELTKAKNHLIGNMLSGLETSDSLAMFYGETVALGKKLKTPLERAEEIRRITSRDLKTAARDIFKNQKLNAVLIGPAHEEKTLRAFLRV